MSGGSRRRQKRERRARRRREADPSSVADDVAALGVALERIMARSIRGLKGLHRTPDPIDSEIAASGLLALWSEHELPSQPDPAGFFASAMIGYLENGR